MKKNEDSLLNKLKQENITNSYSSKVLIELEAEIKNLKPNTVLFEKIKLIKQLQKLNTLESSNEIITLLNEDFEYKYPFYLNETYEQIEQIKKTNLKEHIKTESRYLTIKESALNLKKTRIKIPQIQSSINKYSSFYGTGFFATLILMVAFLVLNIPAEGIALFDTGLNPTLKTLMLVTPFIYGILVIFISILNSSKKTELNKLKKNEIRLIESIKTKANNV